MNAKVEVKWHYKEKTKNRPFHGVWHRLGWGANTAKSTVNVWDFGPLGTVITRLQRSRFPSFPTTLNSSIDIIHSTEKKAIKEGTTSVNSSYKSAHVASNFVVICIMLIATVCIYLKNSFTVVITWISSLYLVKIISVQMSFKIHFSGSRKVGQSPVHSL